MPRGRPRRRRPNRAAPRETLEQRVARLFVTPGHPTAYSAPNRVAKFHGITPAKAREILEGVEGYTLHREFKQPKLYNPYYVRERRKQVQGDLIDIAQLARKNRGVRFLLLLIDIFTKRVWVYPLKDKTAASTSNALREWLTDIDVAPSVLMTDKGTEFTNRRVQDLLRSNNVQWQQALGTMKACMAERANKTLQILLYKYMSEKETETYIDALPALVDTYNERGHRTLEGMSPNEADRPENEDRVRAIFQSRYTKIADQARSVKFAVDDLVRIKTDPKKITSEARAYAQQFKGEYFKIVRINRTLPNPLYYLRSTDTGEDIIGGFYASELQRVKGEVYRIERVLRRQVRNGVRMMRVKWKYFRDPEWIREADVVQVF